MYVGNQYDRDDAFERFLAPAARAYPHQIAGKWPRTDRWPDLNFVGRVPFPDVEALYRRSLATVLLLPDRYASVGHMTQRLFEAVLAGCLPLTPTAVRDAARFAPEDLLVKDGADTIETIGTLAKIAGCARHVELLATCLRRLDVFRLSRQLDTIDHTLTRLHLKEPH